MRHKPLIEVVAEQIAEEERTAPTDLDPPLYEVIDPDALNRLFGATPDGVPRSDGCVKFTYAGYEVRVTSEGEVEVEGPSFRSRP